MTKKEREKIYGRIDWLPDPSSAINDELDDLYDKAYILEQMAVGGFSVDLIIDMACGLFPSGEYDTETALRTGGTAYLADCVRAAHKYHF